MNYKPKILLSLTFLIVIFCLIPQVLATTQCQISTDNSSWANITTTRWDGFIDDENGLSSVQNLEGETLYYIRCRNESHDWGYVSVRTIDKGTEKKMIIAIIILLPMLLGFLLMYGSGKLDEQHNMLKVISLLLGIVFFWTSMHFGMVAVVEFYDFPALQNLMGSTTYWVGMTFFAIASYFLIYIFYNIIHVAAQRKKERLEI